ncbi:tripartite tricarboxylate transporter TctB family protein [Zobellella maritima]|uniref:tripartite tricarboxylate transporter TctB family protein n=1 Tax=Zobellella maritima TaxID=2059725 RepID=UPI000E3094B9|nr:tripartite tricarboxylate transporter TctB family protein [Zobellella maritima]
MSEGRLIALGSLAVSGVLLAAGSNVEFGQDAYRFPNFLAVIIAVFSLVMFMSEKKEKGKSGTGAGYVYSWLFKSGGGENKRAMALPRLAPMFLIIFFYLFLAGSIGLYVTSFLAFFTIVMIYGAGRPKRSFVLKYLAISIVFISAIYLLFAVALQLHTPAAVLM